ncbi:MAG: alpha-hydroxy-acid oxidizing protein [Pseudonocardia sp.]|nr:alpha-hydroxy-acid oxidizing protein [Pseudonocardia sp.]
MNRIKAAHSAGDMRTLARRRLPRVVFDVIDGGAGDEHTLRWNRESLERISLRPRALADVKHVDTTTTILGDPVSMPMMLAPCSFARMCSSGAESAVARAAGRAGTLYAVPGGSGERPEVVARSATGPLWYQLYMKPDHAANEELLDRVEASGYRVLCVTVDTAIKPYREKDLRNGVTLPVTPSPKLALAGLRHPSWSRDFLLGTGSGFDLFAAKRAYDNFADAINHIKSVTPDDVRWLRERWKGPLVIKGILRCEEVPQLVDLGVDGIVVSNHGGRNLDGAPATIDVLAEVVEAAAGRAEVFLDSGVRRGTDVVKALALGAQAVLVGRPYMFALAAGGESGVDRVLELLHNEIVRAMSLLGATSVKEIDRSLIQLPNAPAAPDAESLLGIG